MSSFSKDLLGFTEGFQKMYHNTKPPTSLDNAKEEYYRAKAEDVGAVDEMDDLDRAKIKNYEASSAYYDRGRQPDKDDDQYKGFGEYFKQRKAEGAGALGAGSAPPPAPAGGGAIQDGAAKGQPMLLGNADVDQAINKEETERAAYEASHAGVLGGLATNLERNTQPGAVGGQGQGQVNHAAVSSGANAPPPTQLAGIIEMVKGANKDMPQHEAVLRTFGMITDFYNSTGQFDRAKGAHADMISALRVSVNRFTALAKASAEKGDMDGATKAIVNAYDHIPDGRSLRVEKVKGGDYKFVFKTGGVDNEGDNEYSEEEHILNPYQIAAEASKLNPGMFVDAIAGEAGKRFGGRQYEGAMPKEPDRAKQTAAIDDGFDIWKKGLNDHRITNLNGQQVSEIKGAAQLIFGANNMRSEEAIAAAYSMVAVDPKNPDAKQFSYKEWDGHSNVKKGEVRITPKGGQSFSLSVQEFNILMSKRGAVAAGEQGKLDQTADRLAKRKALSDKMAAGHAAAGKVRRPAGPEDSDLAAAIY